MKHQRVLRLTEDALAHPPLWLCILGSKGIRVPTQTTTRACSFFIINDVLPRPKKKHTKKRTYLSDVGYMHGCLLGTCPFQSHARKGNRAKISEGNRFAAGNSGSYNTTKECYHFTTPIKINKLVSSISLHIMSHISSVYS